MSVYIADKKKLKFLIKEYIKLVLIASGNSPHFFVFIEEI